MKPFSIVLPVIILTDVTKAELIKFAENHGDHFIAENSENSSVIPAMTVVRVLNHETNYRFVLIEEDGETYAAYVPDAYKADSYDHVFETVYPYLRELDLYNFDSIEVSVTNMIF